ncbi:uncharacterized protein LOC128904255 [Rissa tridactyla]|uniref:uncharacterized protein LOC128904255 n=1 Tax=Rissa tridactyla TaxID=75485 RepID=UPI0023BA8F90|nr:uncharacterized protein LOC128904255 [Rissa tridactyla]
MMDFKEEIKPISDTCISETSSGLSVRAGMTDLQGPQMLPELPALATHETHHIFVSYSNINSAWARNLIQSLEAMIPNLKACYHERDFIPGKTIIENMVEAIQGSQKIVLVLSPDFVQSRWCLLEANLSVFQDCLESKPVIPIMLVPCFVPMHLTHLTYIDASDTHFLDKVIKVICTPNHQMKNATMVPYSPPSLYNGKPLLALPAVDDQVIPRCRGGTFSEALPDQLKIVCEDTEVYRKAIRMINEVSSRVSPFSSVNIIFWISACLLGSLYLFNAIFLFVSLGQDSGDSYTTFLGCIMVFATLSSFSTLVNYVYNYKIKSADEKLLEMSQVAGEANSLLIKDSLLVGCDSRVKLQLVYISLAGCRRYFSETFGEGEYSAEEMFQRALHYFSSDYACCVAKKHFQFYSGTTSGHWDEGPCFCQFVSHCMEKESWHWNSGYRPDKREL